MKICFRFYLAASASTLIAWFVFAFAKDRITAAIVGRFSEPLIKLSQGKISDPGLFVEHRLREALWLLTLALLLVGAQWVFTRFARTRTSRNRWAAQGVAGFVLLNIWVGAAANTALFWGSMGLGAEVQNLTQFQFKRILMEDNSTTNRAVLVGSSQTRAQIDENLLNKLLGPKLWTTELHFPGSHGYDLLLIEPQLRQANPQWVICYITEGYFYSGSHGETPPNFLTLAGISDGLHRGAQRYLSKDEILSGVLGNILPLFRCRDVIAQRIVGLAVVQSQQQQYDATLALDLDARAQQFASGFQINEESAFQKQAFEEFVARCQRANRHIILLMGNYNPILQGRIEPSVHADMVNFLQQLQNRYPLVTVVPATDLAEQVPADYEDLSHVNRETQRRFTESLARLLEGYPVRQQSKQ